jgi:two-component system, cell cycle response regulator DivK
MPKILLVEDNEMNRDMLTRRLSRRGYDVAVALDGREAVALAASLQPAVILMDMSLPVMDGWEATRHIKADPATAAIPVIALTAHALPAERDRALEAGCCAFETKPIDFPRLLDLLQTVGAPYASGSS